MSEFELYEIIDGYKPESGTDDEAETRFLSNFQPIDSIEKFTIFIECLLGLTENSLKRDKMLQLLSNCIYECDDLMRLFQQLNDSCENYEDKKDEEILKITKFINILISLPELIANLYGQNYPKLFHHTKYITKLCQTLQQTLISTKKVENSKFFFHQIIARLCLKGYSDIVWNDLMKYLVATISYDEDENFLKVLVDILFGRNCISKFPKPPLESVIKMLFYNISSIKILRLLFDEYFQDSDWDHPSGPEELKVSIILRHKLLQFSQLLLPDYNRKIPDQILFNIIMFLGGDWFRENFLTTWSNSCAFKLRTYAEHFHLCRTMIIGAKMLFEFGSNKEKYRDLVPKFRSATIAGAELHFYSSQMEFRAIGLQTTVILLEILSRYSSIQLELPKFDEIENTENVDCYYLKKLALVTLEDFENPDDNIVEENQIKPEEPEEELTFNANKDEIIMPNVNSEDEVDVSLDSDDDLEPYDMSNDIPLEDDIRYTGKEIETNDQHAMNNISSIQQTLLYDSSKHHRRPLYIVDCLEGLIDYEKPHWMERCLVSCEQIVRSSFVTTSTGYQLKKNPTDSNPFDSFALKLTKILFHLDDRLSMKNFEKLRTRSLVACCVGSPKMVSEYLGGQFYAPFLSIRARLDVLAIFAEASEELLKIKPESEPKIKPPIKLSKNISSKFHRKYFSINLIDSDDDDSDHDDGNYVEESKKLRIEANTKYFSSMSSTSIVEQTNRFVPVSGHFFYPLLRDPAKVTDLKLDLHREDSFVLEQLILTLGILLQRCANHSAVMLMAKELMQFMAMYRNHEQSNVRLSIIVTFYTILQSTPTFYLFGDQLLTTIIEYQLWLKEIIQTNLDPRCTDRACLTLVLISELSKQNQKQQDEDETGNVPIGIDDKVVHSKSSFDLDTIIQQIKRIN